MQYKLFRQAYFYGLECVAHLNLANKKQVSYILQKNPDQSIINHLAIYRNHFGNQI